MPRILTSTFAAAALAVLLGSLVAAQGARTALVDIQPAASLDVVLFTAANAGKVVARTDDRGKGSIQVGDLVNLGKLDVVEEACVDGTRVLLVSTGAEVPTEEGCRRRRVGGFWPGHDRLLQVDLGGGIGTGTKAALAGAAGAGALVFLRGHEAGNSNAAASLDSPNVVQIQPTSTSTPAPSEGPTGFSGTYTGTLTATTNSCGFSPTAPVRGILTVDADGRGTWQKTHLNAGVTFNFDVHLTMSSPTIAKFTASTRQPIGSQMFSVTDAVTIEGNTINITQTLNSASGQSCNVCYRGRLTKN